MTIFDAYPLMFVVEVKSAMFPVLFLRLLLNERVLVFVFGTSVKYVPKEEKQTRMKNVEI